MVRSAPDSTLREPDPISSRPTPSRACPVFGPLPSACGKYARLVENRSRIRDVRVALGPGSRSADRPCPRPAVDPSAEGLTRRIDSSQPARYNTTTVPPYLGGKKE